MSLDFLVKAGSVVHFQPDYCLLAEPSIMRLQRKSDDTAAAKVVIPRTFCTSVARINAEEKTTRFIEHIRLLRGHLCDRKENIRSSNDAGE